VGDRGRGRVDVDAVIEEWAIRCAAGWVRAVAVGLVALDDRADRGFDVDAGARVTARDVANDEVAIRAADRDACETVAGREVTRDDVVVGVLFEPDAVVVVADDIVLLDAVVT